MKLKLKISNRERWMFALSPALLIGGIYVMGYMDGLTKDLKTAQDRLAAAQTPIAPPGPSPTLAKAKTTLEETTRSISDHKAKIEKIEADINDLNIAATIVAEDHEPARIIERVEEVFARNGITPLVSETASEGNAASKVPSALLTILSPKTGGRGAPNGKSARVWHYIFDDETPHFANALRELTSDVPSAVPLSLNFVYNPRNYGETRQLELWLLY